jgi:hypothetical protein
VVFEELIFMFSGKSQFEKGEITIEVLNDIAFRN